jgi:cytochrome c biogenesis protein CcmG/thiol:disulfide interchange protein DsbE
MSTTEHESDPVDGTDPVADEVEPAEPSSDGGGPRRRRPGRAAWVAVPVAAVLVLLILVLATREPATDRVAQSPLLGKPAPAVEGQNLDGGTYDLGDSQGRWVVVNFFATWCQACVKEHPELRAFAAEHAQLGDAEVVSVVFQDDRSTVEEFFEENGGDWPVVLDERTRIGLDYGVTGIPESYLVDPNGIVRVKLIGGVTRGGLNKQLAAAGGGS